MKDRGKSFDYIIFDESIYSEKTHKKMAENFKLNECKSRLLKEDTKRGKLKLVYEWVKTNYISLSEFEELINEIDQQFFEW